MPELPLFLLNRVSVSFSLQKKRFFALKALSLAGYAAQTIGVVGESGSGKSTLAKLLLCLLRPDTGEVLFNGIRLDTLRGRPLRKERRNFQMVFQDPDTSLPPRMTVYEILEEALLAWNVVAKMEVSAHVKMFLARVHLCPSIATQYPHELSGGQKQRVSIARAISVRPKLLICDEALSSLDMPTRASMIDLFLELQREQGLAYFFITHDLATLRRLAHTIAVLYLGTLVEFCPAPRLFTTPLHPYSRALLASVPIVDPKKAREKKPAPILGDIPSITSPPAGCVFHTRCPYAKAECRTVVPPLREVAPGHHVACHFPQIITSIPVHTI